MTLLGSNQGNNCVICLESLLSAPRQDDDPHGDAADEHDTHNEMCDIGVAAPCGHPAHVSCFQQWSAFQNVGSRNDYNKAGDVAVPCPTCQQTTDSFVKIFLRAEPSISWSDDEEEKDDENSTTNTNAQGKNSSSILTTTSSSSSSSFTVPKKNRRGKRDPCGKHHSSADSKKKGPFRKVQWYKQRWLGACDSVKTLKLEAYNRKTCHHSDLVELERTRLVNYRLMKELERVMDVARFRRNAFGLVCFSLGWVCSNKFKLAF